MYKNKDNKQFWVIFKCKEDRDLFNGIISKKCKHIKNPYEIINNEK